MNYIKRKSALQEKRTAKNFGGKTTPASGALEFAYRQFPVFTLQWM